MKRKLTWEQKVKRKANKFAPKLTGLRETTKGRDFCETDARELSVTCRVVDGCLEFTFRGRWLSLNQIMARGWRECLPLEDIIKQKVAKAVIGIQFWADAYQVKLSHHSKLDNQNVVMMPKYTTDVIKRSYEMSGGKYILEKGKKKLKYAGMVSDDDSNYDRGLFIVPDESLDHNVFVMTYIPIEKLDWKSIGEAKRKEAGADRGKGKNPSRVRVQLSADKSSRLRSPGVSAGDPGSGIGDENQDAGRTGQGPVPSKNTGKRKNLLR